MKPIAMCVKAIHGVNPSYRINGDCDLLLQVEVDERQRSAIAEAMIGRMTGEEAHKWAREKFPEWFEEEMS